MEEARSEKCPYCSQAITHKEFAQIEARIKADFDSKMKTFESEARSRIEGDQKKLEQEKKTLEQEKNQTQNLKKQIEEERQTFKSRLQQEADEKLQAERKRLHDEHEAKVKTDQAKLALEHRAVEEQGSAFAAAEKKLAEEKRVYQGQLKKEAEEQIHAKVARLQEESQAKLKEKEENLNAQTRAAKDQETKALQMQKQLQDEKSSYRQTLEKETQEKLKQEQERIQKSLQNKQKELVDEGRKAGRLEGDTDRRNLQKKIEELSRQLEKKTADELGSLSEEELARRLADAFRDDKISRIPKGEQGADVCHEVIHKGLPCGRMIYESKNRKDWLNAYIDRAKEYKTMYKTSSIILVSITFPKGEENFCIREGIVIVHPSIVIPIAEIIRSTLLRLHLANLSHQEAESKMNEIYKFISGDDFKVQIDAVVQNISDLQRTQQKEKDEHNRVWTKQTTLFDALQRSAFTIKSKIDNIIQRTD